MLKMCMRYTQNREDAMIIVNNGFLRVFKKIDQFQAKGSLEGWIRRIVYHSVSDYFRKREKDLKFLVFEEYDKEIHGTVLDKLYADDIISIIDEIPPASGEVFRLFAIEGYTHKEIAEIKGISIGTSKWHLSEARKKLQKLIYKQGTYKQYVVGE